MQNWKLKKKKKNWLLFSDILGRSEKDKQTTFFRPYISLSSNFYPSALDTLAAFW